MQFSANEWRWFHAGTAAYLHGAATEGNVSFEDIGRDPIETMDHSEGDEDWVCPCPHCQYEWRRYIPTRGVTVASLAFFKGRLCAI